MKKVLVILMAMAMFATPAFAGLGDMFEVHSAFKRYDVYIQQGNPSSAANELKAILVIDPGNFDANWKLGEYYMNGSIDSSKRYFKNALLEKPGKKSEVANKFYQSFSKRIVNGNNHRFAIVHAKAAISFNSSLRSQVVKTLVARANSHSSEAVEMHKSVIDLGNSADRDNSIGAICMIAYKTGDKDYYLYDEMKRYSPSIVKRYQPREVEDVVFEKTYSDADANEKGWVRVIDFSKVNVQPGDVARFYFNSPDGEDVFSFENGKWWAIKEGINPYVEYTKKNIPKPGKYRYMKLRRDTNTTVSVKIVRNSIYDPFFTFASRTH